MTCPGCSGPTGSLMVGDLLLDACTAGCLGVWFGPFELERFLGGDRSAARAFLKARPRPSTPPSRDVLVCPACDLPMLRRPPGPGAAGLLYVCPGCGGRWVDHANLVLLITDDVSTEDRQKALDRALFEAMGSSPEGSLTA
jgi:Zn-finger nucleic acid-binding protein